MIGIPTILELINPIFKTMPVFYMLETDTGLNISFHALTLLKDLTRKEISLKSSSNNQILKERERLTKSEKKIFNPLTDRQ